LRTKIEKRIAAHFPERFMTLYSMVTFSKLPYATVLSKSKEQSELLDKIMHLHDIENQWESASVLKLAEEWLKEKGL
jgi:kynurenine 3-monooxygenase